MIKALQLRVRDKHAKALCGMAYSVNFVWNYLNELSNRSIRERGIFLSAYDMQKYTAGSSVFLGIPSKTLDAICAEYATRRRQAGKARLAWRKSRGCRRSLGWIPFPTEAIRFKDGCAVFYRKKFKIWDSYGLEGCTLKTGSFSEDARGRWYFNVAVEVPETKSVGTEAVGIDLGIKSLATSSNGESLESGRWYRDLEPELAKAQRARKKCRVRAIHAKIANRRKDAQHKFSTDLVRRSAAIFVGDVSSEKLVKTRMAKSVLDAGWGQLKTMLRYKCDHAGVVFDEVSEYLTTQVCSNCGCLCDSRPKGIADLGIREWTCDECGSHHDRDVNAALNILARGHARLAGGIRLNDGCQRRAAGDVSTPPQSPTSGAQS